MQDINIIADSLSSLSKSHTETIEWITALTSQLAQVSDFITQYKNDKLRKSLEKECKSEYSETQNTHVSDAYAS